MQTIVYEVLKLSDLRLQGTWCVLTMSTYDAQYVKLTPWFGFTQKMVPTHPNSLLDFARTGGYI